MYDPRRSLDLARVQPSRRIKRHTRRRISIEVNVDYEPNDRRVTHAVQARSYMLSLKILRLYKLNGNNNLGPMMSENEVGNEQPL